MYRFEYDPAPVILAFVLGPLMEISLRESLMMSRGDPMMILKRPIVMVLLAIDLFLIFYPLLARLLRIRYEKPTFSDDD
jgi:putative tricarboxylic transport membrane protein